MPELPEVETVVRALREPLIGRTITGVTYDWPNALKVPDGPLFTAQIVNQPIRAINRRAKYIVITLDPDTLIIHLKMTGRLYVVPDDAEQRADQWVHYTFQLDNAHQLRFSDSRKFGRVYLVDDPQIVLGKLGPEPLDDAFTLDVFRDLLAKRSAVIKPLLMHQGFIAGIGNIYADEALYASRIHPLRHADSLSDDEIARLYAAIRKALQLGIEREGASVNWYRKPDGSRGNAQHGLKAYGQTGNPCERCGHPIEKMVVAQRGTHICPVCQTL
jgi:formamidopyrimidine-DNA glycosylase